MDRPSKVLFPAVRVGYLAVPRDLVARFRRTREAVDVFPATLPQAVLAMSTCYAGTAREPGLVLGCGSTRASQMRDAVRRLKALLD
jgi:hypothetical protein